MLLTKILVSLQLLHYYSISAQPISSSNLLAKRAFQRGYHIGRPIDPSINTEGIGKIYTESLREAEEANVTQKIKPVQEPVHQEASQSKETQELDLASDVSKKGILEKMK
ncbi:hypothetical protein PGT21_019422 [Puccinia graminis f. sp. tritici]|uniref:Uncharacterized protein n=1 Tax=Puccinia graminis f. sp. tritici TaxID=56615 RepID=A0A5B0QWZ2_PUCGR|nr:hypothetical protein PGT21_019422 [Puccinia graminis f. sp. tritici]